MEELKHKIEALLFSSGRSMPNEEIKKICRINDDEKLSKALQDLKVDYGNRASSLMLTNEGASWKITTKEDYFNVIKKVVTETELSKSLMETLAVITWKYPIKQCDLIKIRTNKAYDHLRELEQIGYISRQKHGRTKLIKLTDKFFDYFDLPPEKVKNKFSDFNQIADAISGKEQEIRNMEEEHKKQILEAKKMQEQDEQNQKEELKKEEEEIDLIDKEGHKIKLEEYKQKPEEESNESEKSSVLKTYKSKEREEKIEEKEKSEETKEDSQEGTGESEEKTTEEPEEKAEKDSEEKPVEEDKKESEENEAEKEKQQTEESKDSESVPPKTEEEIEKDKLMDTKADEIVENMIHPKEEEKKEDL